MVANRLPKDADTPPPDQYECGGVTKLRAEMHKHVVAMNAELRDAKRYYKRCWNIAMSVTVCVLILIAALVLRKG